MPGAAEGGGAGDRGVQRWEGGRGPSGWGAKGESWGRVGSSQPKNQTQASHIPGRFFTSYATREALYLKDILLSYAE